MFEKVFEQAISWVFDTGVNLLVALLILLIGLKLIKKVKKHRVKIGASFF